MYPSQWQVTIVILNKASILHWTWGSHMTEKASQIFIIERWTLIISQGIHNRDYCSHMFTADKTSPLYLQVLDISEADMVLAERGLLPQAACILALVERKGPQKLKGFLLSLRQSNHHHLADVLELPNDVEHTGEILAKLRPERMDVLLTSCSSLFCWKNICILITVPFIFFSRNPIDKSKLIPIMDMYWTGDKTYLPEPMLTQFSAASKPGHQKPHRGNQSSVFLAHVWYKSLFVVDDYGFFLFY